MKITQLYVYPIKSLRGVPLKATTPTPHGFPYDRHFMLAKVHSSSDGSQLRKKKHFDEKTRLENMTITYWPELALFLQDIDFTTRTLTVTHSPPGKNKGRTEISLEPNVADLREVNISLHSSPVKAYCMDDKINAWFSNCLGCNVILVYLGSNRRSVLGNLSPTAVESSPGDGSKWLSSLTTSLPSLVGFKSEKSGQYGISFADLAAYLVITEESLRDVSSRILDGVQMDVTKFRANIVVSGAPEAWDEDFWGGLAITSGNDATKETQLILTQNCARCVSLNVDYSTGRPATGIEGSVLKKMMKDRRVDQGAKYSPVFGRYGFVKPDETASGRNMSVGDTVVVSKRNEERTAIKWPGMA